MGIAKRFGSILVLLFVASLILGIGCRSRSKQRISDDLKYEPNRRVDEEVTYEAVGEISFNDAAADLENAKQARMNGDLEKATSLFNALYRNQKIESDIRAESLFALGQIYSDLANPKRDYKQALDLFETLVTEFPESDLLETTQRRIEKVNGFISP
jgi:TPR repeat protein